MGSLADHITASLYPEDPGRSVSDKLISFFSRSMIGAGAPEGVVLGAIGSEYTDVSTGRKYVKTADDGLDTGWVLLLITGEGGGGAGLSDGNKGDITVSSAGAQWDVNANAITLAKLADLAQSTILGRAAGAGTGDPTALTDVQVRTLLGLGTAALTASTAYDPAGSASAAQAAAIQRANHTGSQAISTITGLQTALDAKAPTVSPTFTGNVVVPNADADTEALNRQGADDRYAVYVRWNGSAWETRPPAAEWGVVFLSTNDAAATAPTDINLAVGDIWKRHPDAV